MLPTHQEMYTDKSLLPKTVYSVYKVGITCTVNTQAGSQGFN